MLQGCPGVLGALSSCLTWLRLPAAAGPKWPRLASDIGGTAVLADMLKVATQLSSCALKM